MAVITRRPPTAPPTMAPTGTGDGLCEGVDVGDAVEFVASVPARVYVGV